MKNTASEHRIAIKALKKTCWPNEATCLIREMERERSRDGGMSE